VSLAVNANFNCGPMIWIDHLTTRWSGPGIRLRELEMMEIRVPGREHEEPVPGRSLVPAAQAQAARSR